MGRKYLCTLLMLFFQRALISDDLMAERLSARPDRGDALSGLESRLARLEQLVQQLEPDAAAPPPAASAATRPSREESLA